jgi:ferredoxin
MERPIYWLTGINHTMQVEFDRDTCTGIFNCVHEWEKFIEDHDAGKATLVGSEEVRSDLYVRTVPEDEEFDAKMAARVCPVDAITIFDDEGEQLVP